MGHSRYTTTVQTVPKSEELIDQVEALQVHKINHAKTEYICGRGVGHNLSDLFFRGVHVAQSLVSRVVLFLFFWQLHCLSFFDLWNLYHIVYSSFP